MFSSLKKKTFQKKTALAALALVLLTVSLLVSCDQSSDPVFSADAAQQPNITIQPNNGNWDVGTMPAFNLAVTANVADGGSLSYQWYKNTINSTVNGTATGIGATLSLAKADYATNGDYYFYVVVTNTNNNATGTKTATVTSNVATIQVNGNGGIYIVNAKQPVITVQPSGGSWDVGASTTHSLMVTATSPDSGNLSYQWYKNDSNSTSGGIAVGTGATFTLNKASYTPNGDYYFYVVVTNTNSNATGTKTATSTSAVAIVKVIGNVAAGFQLPAEWIGTWADSTPGGPYDFNIFEAPDIMWSTFDMSSVWIKVKIEEIALLGDEMLLYGKFIEMDDGSLSGWAFATLGSGEYSAIYIKKYSATQMEILQLASSDGHGGYAQPMYQTLAAAKAGLPLNSSFRSTYVILPVTYTKQ